MTAVQRFAYFYPQAYRTILIVGLISFLLAGLTSHLALAEGANPKRSFLTPPKALEAEADPNLPVKPEVEVPSPPAGGQAKGPFAVPPSGVLPPYNLGSQPGTDIKTIGRQMNGAWFGDAHWPALHNLWQRESGWNPGARNRSSGACGIPQALPCSKIPDMSPKGQLEWGLQYIKSRYGNPTNAWRFWQRHHWY
ncbi:MAG TPA: hypothetical protein VNA68_02065 [Candidatus Dormibacteraeota bacterium]|nr:hypothetical protein [Candidatus Dormibacteraeota bacterium]